VTLVDPHLQKLQADIAASIAGLSSEQLGRHVPEKWSTSEILEHLYLTYTGTIKGCTRLLEGGKPLATTATWKQLAQAFAVIELGYMPEGRQSPPAGLPRGLGRDKVVTEIGLAISTMDDLLAQSAHRFGPRTKLMDHPILGPFSAGQWRKFHFVHGMHHLKQIRRLRLRIESGEL
jgi:hypothetical protein